MSQQYQNWRMNQQDQQELRSATMLAMQHEFQMAVSRVLLATVSGRISGKKSSELMTKIV